MQTYNSRFIQDFVDRGYLHQCSDIVALDKKMSQGPIVAYNGFDPTASSLHVGHLLPIMMLRLLQKHGHKPIVLMGGATALVGDPTGKDKSRPMLSGDDISQNIQGIRTIFERYLQFGDGPSDAILVNNSDWLEPLNYLQFLRDFGPHFTINRMLTFDSVRTRLEREQPMTFLEFNYMLLQAYDFHRLARDQNCVLQLAGSDQWGNIVNGIELTRRVEGKEVYGLTAPLLTTSDGQKMGKTVNGAIWLNEEKLSHFDFWQYWRNVPDNDVIRFLKLFTELPLAQIDTLSQLTGADLNQAKKTLADEVTRLARGDDAVLEARKAAEQVFENGGAHLEGLPVVKIDSLQGDFSILDAYIRVGFVNSRSEARRLIRSGGARLNDQVISDEALLITAKDFENGKLKLSAGRKRHIALQIANEEDGS